MVATRFSTVTRLAVPLAVTAVSVALLLMAPSANATAYRIKGTEPDYGSRLKPVIGHSTIPLDRGAADLSDREREDLRQSLNKHAKGDEPAYLDRPLKALISDLTDLRARLNLHETLKVVLVIDDTGQVRSTRILETTSDSLATTVTKAFAAAHFRPAQCAGTPCSMEFPMTLEVFGNPVMRRAD